MKKSIISSVAVALLFSLTAISESGAEPSNAFLDTLESSLGKGSFSSLEKALLDKIKESSANHSVDELLKDRNFMHWVTAAELIRQTGAVHMESLYAKNKKYARFLSTFLKDDEWMQLYLRAGLVPADTDVGLRVLADIWNHDGKSSDFAKYRSLATGTAAAWGAGGRSERLQDAEKSRWDGNRCDPVWRYNFFKESHKAGKLHPNFINLQPWEIRFVTGNPVDDASYRYLQDNIKLPPDQYGSACWFAQYRGTSEFGDTIQGPLFYVAWDRNTGSAQKTVERGGVCGALSTLGHIAAAARGIPAYTVGQPGHCAYGFRLKRGEWLGGFGGPNGGLHNSIFPGPAPTSTNLMEAVFASDENVQDSYNKAALARSFTRLGDVEKAKEAWKETLKTAPLNVFFQQDFQKFASDRNLYTADQWLAYCQGILGIFKGHGFAAMDAISGVEEKGLEGRSEEEFLQWFTQVHDSLASTPVAWSVDITPVLRHQTKLSKGKVADQKILELALATHLQKGDGINFGKVLDWGIKDYVEKGKADVFSASFEKAAANTPSVAVEDKENAKKMRVAYDKAILAAEKAHSLSAFNTLSKAAISYRNPDRGPAPDKLDCPSGELASEGGMLRLSSSKGDRPCDHAGVLTKEGGFFRTDAEEKPEVIVELPKTVRLSGLLLVKTKGSQERMKKMKVSRSTDGATWFDVAVTEEMPYQWKIETADSPEARWIKVESLVPQKEVFHLRNILVFKKND